MMDKLEQATGVAASVEVPAPRRWRIVHTNGRVRLTYDMKSTGPGRVAWAASTLTVDGQRRPLASDFTHYTAIFADPDKAPATSGDTTSPAPRPWKIEDAPDHVQQYCTQIDDALAVEHTVTVGYLDDRAAWVIQITTERATACLRLVRGTGGRKNRRHPKWRLDPKDPISLVVDGVDRSAEVDGKVARMLEIMGRPGEQGPPADGPVTGPAPAARSNAVTTRRATVIRV